MRAGYGDGMVGQFRRLCNPAKDHGGGGAKPSKSWRLRSQEASMAGKPDWTLKSGGIQFGNLLLPSQGLVPLIRAVAMGIHQAIGLQPEAMKGATPLKPAPDGKNR